LLQWWATKGVRSWIDCSTGIFYHNININIRVFMLQIWPGLVRSLWGKGGWVR